ncbi:cupin domain-containing protein [Planctomycetota bacterium]
MRISKNDVPVKISIPGATARQEVEFGDSSGYGKFAGEYFSLAAGTDIKPLLKGLEDDLCQSPHWGYLIEGEVILTYANGEEETTSGGDLFYWPPRHTVRVEKDAEIILFSPQAEHCAVVDHLHKQLVEA